jgi:hypothetical protein
LPPRDLEPVLNCRISIDGKGRYPRPSARYRGTALLDAFVERHLDVRATRSVDLQSNADRVYYYLEAATCHALRRMVRRAAALHLYVLSFLTQLARPMKDRPTRSCPALLPISLLLAGCSGGACKNEVVSGLPSPDGAAIAFVFHRSCGTPAEVSTDVSIIAFRDSLHDGPGNVLVVPDEQPVKVSWQSPKKLLVTGFSNPTHQQAQQIDSITAEFK